MVPWLGLGAFVAMGPSSIPGQGTNIPRGEWYSQKKKKKKSNKKTKHQQKRKPHTIHYLKQTPMSWLQTNGKSLWLINGFIKWLQQILNHSLTAEKSDKIFKRTVLMILK